MAGTMADIAIIGGRKYWAGGPYSGQPVDSTPANAGDLTQYQTPSYTRQFTAPQQPQPTQQMPTWAGSQSGPVAQPYFIGGQSPSSRSLPTPPWMNVASGASQGGGFNPGGKFGSGGATLPSLQRWGRLAPTERQGMQGYWNDQLGVSSDDVMSQMQKLRPNGFGAAPRWSGF